MPKVVDAVLAGVGPKYQDKLYFFQGDQYVRVDWGTGTVDPGYPLPLSVWGLPSPFDTGVDAAVNGAGKYQGKAYFFKGSQYVRYDWAEDKVDPGYPLPIALWKVTAPFAAGIDAALEGGAGYEGFTYFFKGNQYLVYDWNADTASPATDASGAEKNLMIGWNLPSPFRDAVNAAVNDKRNGGKDAYFYSGDQVVRYTWATNACATPAQFLDWTHATPWLATTTAAAATVGTAIDAHTAMIGSDKAPYAHNFAAKDPKSKDWQAVWGYTPGSASTVVMMYFHGLHGLVTVANPSQPASYIFSGPPKPPPGGKLAAPVKGLYPVQPMDGILPSFWASNSCTYNYTTHLKAYGSLYYPVAASAPKYRVDEVAKNKGYVALVPEVGDQSGNRSIASGFQLGTFINDVLAKFGGPAIVDPVTGAAESYLCPAASSIQKALITGHSAGGGVLKQMHGDPLFTSSGALSAGKALSVAIGVFDGLYGSWGTGYGALYKANNQLRIWLVNLSSSSEANVVADFASAGIGQRELDATGTALSKNPVNKKTSKTGLYLYTMTHTLGTNDGGVQAALTDPSHPALFIQTNTPHDEIPNHFLPWMADAL